MTAWIALFAMTVLFAFLHHLAAFTLVSALALEFVLVRQELTLANARRLHVADAAGETDGRTELGGPGDDGRERGQGVVDVKLADQRKADAETLVHGVPYMRWALGGS